MRYQPLKDLFIRYLKFHILLIRGCNDFKCTLAAVTVFQQVVVILINKETKEVVQCSY